MLRLLLCIRLVPFENIYKALHKLLFVALLEAQAAASAPFVAESGANSIMLKDLLVTGTSAACNSGDSRGRVYTSSAFFSSASWLLRHCLPPSRALCEVAGAPRCVHAQLLEPPLERHADRHPE